MSTKETLERAVARMREVAGDQRPEPVASLELSKDDLVDAVGRLAVEGPGEASQVTGKIKLASVEKSSLVRLARRGKWRPDDPLLHASCQLLCAYGYATKHPVAGSHEYRVTPAGRIAAKRSKLSMRLGGR